MRDVVDAVLFDIGGTLVAEADPATPVDSLVATVAPEIVEQLAGLARTVRVGAVTNTAVMNETAVRALLVPSGLDALLEVVVTSVDVGAEKPDPRPMLIALERMGLADPSRVLYVGDRETDAEAAAAVGMSFAWIGSDGPVAAVEAWVAEHAGRRFEAACAAVGEPDPVAEAAAVARHEQLTKPSGALGRLEAAGIWLSAVTGECPPPVPHPAAVAVFAGDHGVHAEGVSPWPQEITAMMVANFATGGAAINVLARQVGASVMVVDVGVATDVIASDVVLTRRIRNGTANLATGPAMTPVEARRALDVGVEVAQLAIEGGARCLVTGEMGIGNTTPSAALIVTLTGRTAQDATGRGTGIDDETHARKTGIVELACGRAAGADPLEVLAEVGGFEIAALAGYIVGGAAQRVPVMIDGVIALAALLVAESLCPGVARFCAAGHRSTEPGATIALEHLGLAPLLDLGLRLGEGTGAILAVPLLEAGARILSEMATFDDLERAPAPDDGAGIGTGASPQGARS